MAENKQDTHADDDFIEVNPQSGEVWDRQSKIQGELVRVQESVGPNNSAFYTIKTEEGNMGVWGSTIIDARMSELSIGDTVKIEPLGVKKSPKTKREYMDFKVSYRPGPRHIEPAYTVPNDDAAAIHELFDDK